MTSSFAQGAALEGDSARVTISSSWAGSSMVEQLTLNQRVAGSSPARLTNSPIKTGVAEDTTLQQR